MKKFIASSSVSLVITSASSLSISYFFGLEYLGKYSIYMMIIALSQSVISFQLPLIYNRRFSRTTNKLRQFILSVFTIYLFVLFSSIIVAFYILYEYDEFIVVTMLAFGSVVGALKSIIDVELRQKRKYLKLTLSSSLPDLSVFIYVLLINIVGKELNVELLIMMWSGFKLFYLNNVNIKSVLFIKKNSFRKYIISYFFESSKYIFVGLLKNVENNIEIIIFSSYGTSVVGAVSLLKKVLGISRFVNSGVGLEISSRIANTNQSIIVTRDKINELVRMSVMTIFFPLTISILFFIYSLLVDIKEFSQINSTFILFIAIYIILRFADTSLRSLLTRVLHPKGLMLGSVITCIPILIAFLFDKRPSESNMAFLMLLSFLIGRVYLYGSLYKRSSL